MLTYDTATVDSTGAFLVSQLESLDPIIHQPLQGFTWSRDFPIRNNFQMGDDATSYLLGAYAATGGVNPSGKSFIAKRSTTIGSVAVDLSKNQTPLYTWANQINYSVIELAAWQKLGQSIDTTQVNALNMKYNQDADIMAYLGDTDVGAYGLLNLPALTATVVPTGATSGAVLWSGKTDTEVQNDINTLLMNTYYASGNTVFPNKVILSPGAFAALASRTLGNAGFQSLLNYVRKNNVASDNSGEELMIVQSKWLGGTTSSSNPYGVRATDSMVAYSQNYDYIRFPILPLTSLPLQNRGIFQEVPYLAKMGQMEVPRPETVYVMYGMR